MRFLAAAGEVLARRVACGGVARSWRHWALVLSGVVTSRVTFAPALHHPPPSHATSNVSTRPLMMQSVRQQAPSSAQT